MGAAGAENGLPTSATLLLLDAEGTGVTVRRATVRERLLSRALARSLDQQLVQGAHPDRDALLALRSRVLVRPATRRLLARSIATILSDAVAPLWPPRSFRMPVARRNVLEAADGLTALKEMLLRQAPLPAQGVAAVEMLLSDGAGPVYNPHSTKRLPALVQEALQALEPLDHF